MANLKFDVRTSRLNLIWWKFGVALCAATSTPAFAAGPPTVGLPYEADAVEILEYDPEVIEIVREHPPTLLPYPTLLPDPMRPAAPPSGTSGGMSGANTSELLDEDLIECEDALADIVPAEIDRHSELSITREPSSPLLDADSYCAFVFPKMRLGLIKVVDLSTGVVKTHHFRSRSFEALRRWTASFRSDIESGAERVSVISIEIDGLYYGTETILVPTGDGNVITVDVPSFRPDGSFWPGMI